MANYEFVVNSTFDPLSMQEMLYPITAYQTEYEKMENSYLDLNSKADKFKYLSESLPEGSKSRAIYEKYANDLKTFADDMARNNLTYANKPQLLQLKRRFNSEIGQLEEADKQYQKQMEIRNTLAAQGKPMLYASNLSIDNFLPGQNPNLYSISSDDLYNRGTLLGKTISSRSYNSGDAGSTLNGYYRKWKETVGINPGNIDDFMRSSEVQKAVDDILKEKNVTQNLTGADYETARQAVLNGLYNGIVYQENVRPVKDGSVMTEKERKTLNMQEIAHGLRWNPNTRQYEDQNEWLYEHDENGNRSGIKKDLIPTGYVYDPIKKAFVRDLSKARNITSKEDKLNKSRYVIPENLDIDYNTKKFIQQGAVANGGKMLTNDLTVKTIPTSSNTIYTPKYFDALNRNAASGIDKDTNPDLGSDTKWYDAQEFKSEEPKEYIKDYIRDLFEGHDWSDEELEEVYNLFIQEKYQTIHKDEDWLSDNHWAITAPGADPSTGKFKDNGKLMRELMSEINQIILKHNNIYKNESEVSETPNADISNEWYSTVPNTVDTTKVSASDTLTIDELSGLI